jgi:restriction endonuclease S subunit
MKQSLQKLGELVEIRSGYQFRKGVSHDPIGKARVLQLKNVTESSTINWDNLEQVSSEGVGQDYFLKFGDVLLSARGTKNQSILVDVEVQAVIAPSYLLVLRIKSDHLRAGYLAWYLRQPQAQVQIERARRGTTIQLISREELADLIVPLPPLEVQDKVAMIGGLAQREQELLELLKIEREKFVSACLREAIGGGANG